MRLLMLVLSVGLLVAAPALAGSAPAGVGDAGYCWGGGVIIGPPPGTGGGDPGFCWGGGVIVGPPGDGGTVIPPDGGGVVRPGESGEAWPGEMAPAGGGITSTYGAGPGPMLNGAVEGGGASAATSPAAERSGSTGRGPRSEMYIPPAVWQWIAQHPVHRG